MTAGTIRAQEADRPGEAAGDQNERPARDHHDFAWYPVLKPSYFYSPTAGLGLGFGLNGRHLFNAGDAVLLRSRVQQYRQSVKLGWASSPPHPGWQGLQTIVNLYRNLRESFYGIGAGSQKDHEFWVDRRSAAMELRLPFRPSRRLWIQPRLELRVDRLLGFHALRTGIAAHHAHEKGTRLVAGIGLDAATEAPFGRLQAHWTAFEGDDAGYRRAGVMLDRTWKLEGHRLLSVQAMLDVSFGGGPNTPYYLLPRLDDRLAPGWDRNRFYNRDRVVLTVVYVQPVFEILKSHAVEGMIHAGLSQVYGDVWEDFRLDVAWGPDRATLASGTIPLEPTFSAGSRIVSRKTGKPLLSASLGVSSEGFQATTFQITHYLSDWRSEPR